MKTTLVQFYNMGEKTVALISRKKNHYKTREKLVVVKYCVPQKNTLLGNITYEKYLKIFHI
jgi:hypothetical protein